MPRSLPRLVWRRIGWMVLIWLGSVLTMGAASLLIRFWLHA